MAKRQSLSTFSPAPQPKADGATIVTAIEAESAAPVEPRKGPKYPHVSVYLRPDEIRTLKLLSLESDMKVSDIGAMAIREWLKRNGHSRAGRLANDA